MTNDKHCNILNGMTLIVKFVPTFFLHRETVKPPVPQTVYYDDEPWTPGAYTVFKIIMSARLCAAAWNIVGDCDETFNYWEPVCLLETYMQLNSWLLLFTLIDIDL